MLNRSHIPAIVLGSMTTLAGVGLSRFAYTPLLPLVIEQQWFSSQQAVYLSAANLFGYLLGALSAHALAKRLTAQQLIMLCMALVAITFLLCATPAPFAWFFSARLISGVAGGVLMVLGPSLALAHTHAHDRPALGPLLFTGIGLGALLSATLIPWLMAYSLSGAWLALSLLAAAACLLTHHALRTLKEISGPTPPADPQPLSKPVLGLIGLIVFAYALDAAGFIPHTLFWVDFLSREAGFGTQAAAQQWALFGLGAICGPFFAALLVRKIGCEHALMSVYLIKASAVALPLLSVAFYSQSVSSFLVGALTPGIVSLTSTRIAQCVSAAQHRQIWGWATAAFALSQALSGYGMAYFYTHTNSYMPLFAIGAGCLAAGALLLSLSRFCVVPVRSLP